MVSWPCILGLGDRVVFNVGYIEGMHAIVKEFLPDGLLRVELLDSRGAYGKGETVDCMASELEKGT